MRRIRRIIRTGILSTATIGAVCLAPGLAPAAMVNAVWNSAADVPVTANGYAATGNTVQFTLNFTPATGVELTVVKNTALGFIAGRFDNLTQGQAVALSYAGATYPFVANYYGGNGNDLVLVWAGNRAFAWGYNYDGELGDGSTTIGPPYGKLLPTPVSADGALAGKTILALAAGGSHSLALCADGTLAAWGDNYYGQLGDNTTGQQTVPVAVSTAPAVSALYNKTVVAIAAGWAYSLALCSDGTVAAWGYNGDGQLGDNSTADHHVPTAVNTATNVSALQGKTVVAIAAGQYHGLALCSDGTLAAWGGNFYGQLGDGSTTNRNVPVAVSTNSPSALSGKRVVAVAAGGFHSLALCSDGTVAAWGADDDGQLGDGGLSGSQSLIPVAVTVASGSALSGKTVVAIAAGNYHSLALCSNATLAAWGLNSDGELGDGTTTNRNVPVTVSTNAPSALYGKTPLAISAGGLHSLALCSESTLAAWGHNGQGELGDNTTTTRLIPVTVNTTPLAASERFIRGLGGSSAYHTLALVAKPAVLGVTLTGAKTMPNRLFQFAFTGAPGQPFTVLATTNPAVPLGNWSAVTGLTELPPGQFQFTDSQATNSPRRFYRVRSP